MNIPFDTSRILNVPRQHDNNNPLWQGPCRDGWNGGVTQSMIGKFLSCRERFRLKYILGLEPMDKWNHRLGYGNMWHVCEEALAKGGKFGSDINMWEDALGNHADEMIDKYPFQREEIVKWFNVCLVQFPEYINYWSEHDDVKNRTPLLQEQVFDVPYKLPSGRVVRLRGKWDSVDLIEKDTPGKLGSHRQTYKEIWQQENKTKGDVDKAQIERQLKFDLQTMLYHVALVSQPTIPWCNFNDEKNADHMEWSDDKWRAMFGKYPVKGVIYNVVRRPLSGGKGNISPKCAKSTKNKYIPAESPEEFYERLRRDYLAKEPEYWFFRVQCEISDRDIQVFRETCLDPILNQMCDWYDHITGCKNPFEPKAPLNYYEVHWRMPFGIYDSLKEGGATEYDAYLDNGSEVGLRRNTELFPELKVA